MGNSSVSQKNFLMKFFSPNKLFKYVIKYMQKD